MGVVERLWRRHGKGGKIVGCASGGWFVLKLIKCKNKYFCLCLEVKTYLFSTYLPIISASKHTWETHRGLPSIKKCHIFDGYKKAQIVANIEPRHFCLCLKTDCLMESLHMDWIVSSMAVNNNRKQKCCGNGWASSYPVYEQKIRKGWGYTITHNDCVSVCVCVSASIEFKPIYVPYLSLLSLSFTNLLGIGDMWPVGETYIE